MPALNIYVTDELKDRMNKVDANWSEICRRAIEVELLRFEEQASHQFELVEVKEWISESLDPTSVHSNVVVKPFLHKTDSSKNEVKVLLDFYTELMSELHKFHLTTLKGNLGNLLEVKHRADVLFPGRDWLSGSLGIKLQMCFNHPVTSTQKLTLEPVKAELVTLSIQEEHTNFSVKNEVLPLLHAPTSQLATVEKFIDIEPEIVEYESTNFKVPSFPSEVYSDFRKAWNNVYEELYCGKCKPISSTIIKRLWKGWYHPNIETDIENWGFEWSEKNSHREPEDEQEELVNKFYEEFLGDNYCGGRDWIFLAFIEFVSKFIFDGEFLELSRIDPLQLNSLPLDERDSLPAQSGIYFVLDELGTIHYIGMSVNLQRRWYSHHRQEDFDLIERAKIAYISALPKHYLREIEAALIQSFVPRLNVLGKLA
ncbi:GIY-YIG nuclease family protein [Pseudanabaena sp. PCC 6802]|uniref:GIY-YIG nuclease family protein n=1 Tax=Pseudanabaena sp. PCC 6802 TaxID=118173 RepID=UPI0003458A69|nr:GIY-YIG nuclease family protein [Pseudanabaena sp. PCC 6802]